MSFGRLGSLGAGFGRLGGGRANGSAPVPPNTLRAGVGTFNVTGIDMAPVVYYLDPSDVGAFTLSGQAVGLTSARSMAAAVGTFTETGVAATLTYTPASSGFSITFTDHAEQNSGATTYTWSSRAFAIGAAAGSRIVVAAVASRGGATAPTPSSVTIGGVTATKVVEGNNVVVSTSNDAVSLWQAAVPTGTTATVSVVFGVAPLRAGCAVFSILGSNGVAPSGAAIASDSTNTNSTGTITVPSGGGSIIAVCTNFGGISSVTGTTNWTADTATTPAIVIGSSLQYIVGHDTSHSGSTAYTATWDQSTQAAGAFAAWSP